MARTRGHRAPPVFNTSERLYLQERLGDFHMALEMNGGFQPNEFYGRTTHQYLDSFGWGAAASDQERRKYFKLVLGNWGLVPWQDHVDAGASGRRTVENIENLINRAVLGSGRQIYMDQEAFAHLLEEDLGHWRASTLGCVPAVTRRKYRSYQCGTGAECQACIMQVHTRFSYHRLQRKAEAAGKRIIYGPASTTRKARTRLVFRNGKRARREVPLSPNDLYLEGLSFPAGPRPIFVSSSP
ncbi:hypothetical protein B0H14DRAFT_3514012 [Mycena olivaceomarginata]|nr:hypothetical protein B0H14DRAFT_3514012 [Mycena olivaceomarginata]